MSAKPKILESALYQLLRDENVSEFNKKVEAGDTPEMSCGDFRGLDLRGWVVDKMDLSNAYFRNADLRGIDFRQANIEGASFKGANVSGCYFPIGVSAQELMLSVQQGTRIRHNK